MKKNNITTIASYYYLGLAIGFINRDQVITWADNCIENFKVPYEFVELSLSRDKSLEEMLSILKKIYNQFELITPLSIILYDIRTKYINNDINEDELFTFLSSLYTQGNAIGEDEELLYLLDIINDRFYLASQGIYGSKEDVIDSTLEELKKFERSYKEFIRIIEEE
ncbi:hypothetical protein NQ117_06550 [Paenibacillus sp. SC116]|uniref:hypothetical protein n=1 Tax=Paenibacillus sp. SC116 TaxID=2968986 RepID=UPI00215B6382|nr:hypothetical protein [Paenibacillus sp. SC116]MCR8843338.1 hypothetical protein [Paenibacillus sp. SC116]